MKTILSGSQQVLRTPFLSPSTLKPPHYHGILVDTGKSGFDSIQGIEKTLEIDTWANRFVTKKCFLGKSAPPVLQVPDPTAFRNVGILFWTRFCYRPMFEIPDRYWDGSQQAEKRTNELSTWLIHELGGEEFAELPPSFLYAIMPKESEKKDDGPLLANGQANLFFFRDGNGSLVLYQVHWNDVGWRILPIKLPFYPEWSRDGLDAYDFYSHGRIFSRPQKLIDAGSPEFIWA